MNVDKTSEQTVVIVGAGMAGGNAAVTLREEGWQGRVLLLGTESGIPFGRPPLSKTYLRGEEGLNDWYVKPADWYGKHNIEFRHGVTVQQVNVNHKQVRLEDGTTVDYDKLILCTGGKNRNLSVPGATLAGIYQLRTIAESDAIRQAAKPGMRVVIVGMGFIGSEVAASLRQMGLDVTVVLSGSAPLTKVLGDEAATTLAAIHREHGVQLVMNDHVTSFEGNERVEHVLTAQGKRLNCDMVVAAVGITPVVDVLKDSGIALDNGILVNERCETNIPNVFAAGDVANVLHPVFGRARVEHYNNAEKQGQAVARAVLGKLQAYDYIYSFWSDQYEHKIEYVGLTQKWERIVVRGSYDSKKFLAFYLKEGVMQAAFGLNRGGDPELEADSDLRVCQDLIAKRVRLSESALADESVDLQSFKS